jgi:hypothetical protein
MKTFWLPSVSWNKEYSCTTISDLCAKPLASIFAAQSYYLHVLEQSSTTTIRSPLFKLFSIFHRKA